MSKEKLTMELAKKIKQAIEEYQEFFTPYLFDKVAIVGGIKERGYSDHDIDIVIHWDFDIDEPKEVKRIKQILEHIVHYWLKEQGFPIEKLDIHSYIYLASYHPVFGGWNRQLLKKKE